MKTGSGTGGFSLVEAVVAALLLGIASAGTFSLIAHLLQGAQFAADLTESSARIQDRFESLYALDFGDLSTGSIQEDHYEIRWAVEPHTDHLMQVTLKADWTTLALGARSVTFHTLVSEDRVVVPAPPLTSSGGGSETGTSDDESHSVGEAKDKVPPGQSGRG